MLECFSRRQILASRSNFWWSEKQRETIFVWAFFRPAFTQTAPPSWETRKCELWHVKHKRDAAVGAERVRRVYSSLFTALNEADVHHLTETAGKEGYYRCSQDQTTYHHAHTFTLFFIPVVFLKAVNHSHNIRHRSFSLPWSIPKDHQPVTGCHTTQCFHWVSLTAQQEGASTKLLPVRHQKPFV